MKFGRLSAAAGFAAIALALTACSSTPSGLPQSPGTQPKPHAD
ncbi:hypothetical protein [Glutamicibacter ardleyensis]